MNVSGVQYHLDSANLANFCEPFYILFSISVLQIVLLKVVITNS